MVRRFLFMVISFVFFLPASNLSASLSLPLDLPLDEETGKTVTLLGRIPARYSVEDYIRKNGIDLRLVSFLYDKTIANEALNNRYRHILVGEEDNLSIHVNKKTKEIIDVEFFDDSAN